MKYSVLIAVYEKDTADCLRSSLESIYEAQTRKPDEIVIAIDGPIGCQLREVIDHFCKDKENIVKIVASETNRGLGEALRMGTAECSGDYIFRMDADDISLPERFDIQAKYVETHPEIDVLGGDIAEFCDDPDKTVSVRSCPSAHKDICRMSKKRNPMNHVSVCIKKSALERCGGYRPLLLAEDYFLWVRMISQGCLFANLNVPLVNVRTGENFYKKRGSKTLVKSWRTIQKYMLEKSLLTKWEALMNMMYIRVFVFSPRGFRKLVYKLLLRNKAH